MSLPYYGEEVCSFSTQKGPCQNKAYYFFGNKLGCGVHIKNSERITLTKRSKKEVEEIKSDNHQAELDVITAFQQINLARQARGDIVLCKISMMKSPSHKEGYYNIYPNYKDGGRKDGLGCPALSPKSIGPIEHGQLGVLASRNLENFHQGSKCYRHEVDVNGFPTGEFYAARDRMFTDPEPHRHKIKGEKPLYSVWIDKKGGGHCLNYIQSRQFYCNFYERAVLQMPEFKYLQDILNKGVNIQICGYDAYEMKKEEIEKEYLNEKFPFGHERVLFALLSISDPNEYPWRKHKIFEF